MRRQNYDVIDSRNPSETKTPTVTQTPIEIALQIDENGMTTASQLYLFLELNPTQFSRWCKRNILNNKFATENVDYIRFDIAVDSAIKGQTKTDYKLTSDFAKKLSMTGTTERHEEARKYFIACEQGLKVAAEKLRSNQLDLQPLINAIAALTTNMTKIQEDISSLKEEQIKLPEKKQSYWKKNTFNKLNILTNYAKANSDDSFQLKDSIRVTINEMEATYDIGLSDYVRMYKSEYALDTDPYALDVIEHYKEIRDMYTLTVNSIMDKLHLQAEKEKNIFDELAEKLPR